MVFSLRIYQSMAVYASLGAVSELFRVFTAMSYQGFVAKKETLPFLKRGALGAFIVVAGILTVSKYSPVTGTGLVLITANAVMAVLLYRRLKKGVYCQSAS